MTHSSWRLLVRLALLAITILSWVVAVFWFIDQPGYEPLLAVITGLGTLIAAFYVRDERTKDSVDIGVLSQTGESQEASAASETEQQRALRNRQNMLKLVYNTWIEGVLDKSLYNEVLIDLGMERHPKAVERPWDVVVQMPGQTDRKMPRGTKIIDVSNEANGALLILGEPGSGKTTMLLELARQTIARAEDDPTRPIPVVFNLSSWEPRQALAEWVVDELVGKYYIPKNVAQTWVENDDLQLLLDGLDEVKEVCRAECIEAINAFRQEHAMQLIVCSRVKEYEGLVVRLKLQGAILLQPLTPEQTDEYFKATQLEAVRYVLQNDADLQEMARSPLMLNIMVLAYQDTTVEELRSVEGIEARRKHLVSAYIRQMFTRRGGELRYSPKQTISWLAWLAGRMIEQRQSIFLLENMNVSWLDKKKQVLSHRILYGLCIGLTVGLIAGLVFGVEIGLVVGLVVGLVFRPKNEPTEALSWSWKGVRIGLLVGLITGLFVGLTVGLRGELGGGRVVWAIDGLSVGLSTTLYGGLIGGLLGGLLGGLSVGLSVGLESSVIETRSKPGQGLQASFRNALIAGLIVGLSGGLIGVLSSVLGSVLTGELNVDLSAGLYAGLLSGLIFGLLNYGSGYLVNHYTLRLLLYRDNAITWRYNDFLDYATERIFLRQVGGGYIFTHLILLEHFAEMGRDKE